MTKKSTLRATIALMRARLAEDEQGASAIEYALMASGIGAAVAATVYALGGTTKSFYSSLAGMF